ncbi:hypothetical protein TVAGG3_0716730 [Trichomonas vaginalis G3]|uniref:hypothetical protein n=1 Tax=Trichomonas vaginalis (strain ATCC PRA-98 / G3) TaxID=412133 RepID=UPI0021E5A652|nr:hypothetical protein TVAGG3_0716730 [Trichomonas vaginalis G3]KAI5510305.1 hypothetical protein TVAGG3_0716730 [Trichomonas vaginalis G3]
MTNLEKVKIEDYTANGQEINVNANIPVPSTVTYESGEKQLSIYVIDELSIKSNIETFSFTVKNKPELLNFELNPNNVISGQDVHIEGDINDLDKTKKVFAYCKFDVDSEKQKIAEFVSDTTAHKINFDAKVPTYDSIGKKSFKVWATDVENADAPDDAKTIEFEVITKPTVEFEETAKRIYSASDVMEIKGNVKATTEVTLHFYIDGILHEGSIESVKQGTLFQGFKITDKIGFGKHKIFVTVVDKNGIESDPSAEYEFQVNNGPELYDVARTPDKIKVGEEITITGYVEDVDSGDEITIIVMIGILEGRKTTIKSEGKRKEFNIIIKTSKENGLGWKLISVSAIDKNGKKSSVKELSVQIEDNSIESNTENDKEKDKTPEPNDNSKTKKIVIPVGISLGAILVIVIVIVIVLVVIKKKKNSNSDIVSDNEAYMNNNP